jgi:predicted ATPase
MGDGIAAFFGLESANGDDHLQAALAALELCSVIEGYAEEARAAWGVNNLSVRVGINTGRVATGLVGGSAPQVVALGDAVNVAARLQALADPGSILVGEGTARLLSSSFLLRPVGAVSLRGRRHPTEAYVLVGKSTACAKERTPGTLVGRTDELARLHDRIADLSFGRGQVVLVIGEAGLGKTRLLEELRKCITADVWWLSGRCMGDRTSRPYGALVEALRDWLGVTPEVPEIVLRTRLTARTHDLLGADAERIVPPLARLVGITPRTVNERTLDELPLSVLQANMHQAFSTWLSALAGVRPVILALDNIDRADEATTRLVGELMSLTDKYPIMLALSLRPDPTTIGLAVRSRALKDFSHRTEELHLSPLSTLESERLLVSLDVEGRISRSVRRELVRRAEGNPLFLEELFNAIARDGSTPEEIEKELPLALEGLLLSRIDKLPADACAVLHAAAVLGRDFSRVVLEHMAIVDDLDAAVTALLRADIVRERRLNPIQYTFKHGLLREAALGTLTEARMRELHARAAWAIETANEAEVPDEAAHLAWHYLASGDVAKGVSLLEDLGERFASACSYRRAIEVLSDCRNRATGVGLSSADHERVMK